MVTKICDYLRVHYKLILPFVLTVVLSTAIFSVYMIPVLSVWTLAAIAVSIIIFILCEFTNKHHFIGGTIITVIVMLALRLFFHLIMGSDYGESFRKWFLTGAEQVSTRFEFLLAILISLVPFLGVTIYYFTNVLYRMSFLTLVSLIPCALYVKVLSEIDNVYVCLIAIINVAILIISRRSEHSLKYKIIGKQASVLSVCVFMLIVLITSSVIPKEQEARYYDRFEALFMDSSFTGKLSPDYSFLSEFSGNADMFSNFTNRTMYILYGESAPYFKRQNFDYYDFDNDRWYGDKEYSELLYTRDEWSEHHSKLSLANLQNAIKAAEQYEYGFAEKYGLSRLAGYSDLSDTLQTMYIQPNGFGAVYYIAPARCVDITLTDVSMKYYITQNGVFRNIKNKHPDNMMYEVKFYDEYESRFFWFELGGADFSDEDSIIMLTELEKILSDNNSIYADTAAAFIKEYEQAEKYKSIYQSNTDNISDRIKQLAAEITNGCIYDWEKANALQNYFVNNDYIYSLEYISDNKNVEHFLFESQKGSCSDYATAFVLMARSVGLNARYTEGYSPDITSRESTYVIKDSCSHAYPEVFIQNMGWIVFEPTVPSDYSQVNPVNDDIAISIDYELVFVMCLFTGVILLAALLIILFIPIILDIRFMKNVRQASADNAIIMMYKRVIEQISIKHIKNAASYTPYELMQKLNELLGCNISCIAFTLEEIIYAGKSADDQCKDTAINEYNEFKQALKEYKKSHSSFTAKRKEHKI